MKEFGRRPNGDLLFAAESTDAITVSDEASSFIKENAEFFPSDSIEKFQDNIDESITYKMVMKEPDKYGNKIMKANDLYVVQINTSQIYKDCEDKYTYAILCDNDLNIYQIYMMGELPNIYEGDTIKTMYGTPVGNNSYESSNSGFVNSVVVAPCWIQK